MTHNLPRFPKGFSLIELAVILSLSVSVGAVLAPSLSHTRSQARGMSSEGNLAMIGQSSAMYAADHDNRIFTFSWKAGEKYFYQPSGTYRSWDTDQIAVAKQLQDILLTHTGRHDGIGRIYASHDLLSNRRYSHVVLADYMGGIVSDPIWADPNDVNLLSWQNNPLGYLEPTNNFPYGNGFPEEFGYDSSSVWLAYDAQQKWAFGSSYHVVPHSWQQDVGQQYIPYEGSQNLFIRLDNGFGDPPVSLGDRRYHEVRFPSAKVHMFEEFDREQAGSPYFAYDHAQPAKLMFDGSINTAMSGLAASSVSPADYTNRNKFVWEQTYVPFDTFPVPLGGLEDPTLLNMRYRWTLGGLQGIDYPQMLSRP